MDGSPERQQFSEKRRNKNEMGAFSFAYFSLGKQRKVRPAAGKTNFNIKIRAP